MANKPTLKMRLIVIGVASTIIFMLSAFITIAFFEEGMLAVLRNYFLTIIVFLLVYFLWIKLFENYKKIYKFGL